MDLFSVSGWAIGLFGVMSSVYYGQKAESLKKDIKTFNWAEIRAGADYLAKQIKQDGLPEAFFATDSRGGLIAKLIVERIDAPIPVYVGTCFENQNNPPTSMSGFFIIKTDRWTYFLPEILKLLKDHSLVLVDDVAFSGETIAHIRRRLSEDGFTKVKAASLLTSEIASRQQLGPHWFWRRTTFSEILFPWGRMR